MLQVDNVPPSVSRSGKLIDLFPSGPISSIGNNAPTLAAIMHRGVRLKKVTTKRAKTSPSVAASALAQDFKVNFYTDFIFTSNMLVLTNLHHGTSKPAHRQGPEAQVPMPPSLVSRREKVSSKSTRAQTKCQRVATPPPPPVSPIPVESSPSSPKTQTQQEPFPSQPQEAPQVEEPHPEEPQLEVPQPEDTSADVHEQTINPSGSIIASIVSSIQTSIAPPQGNILFMRLSPMNLFSLPYNYFCFSFSLHSPIGDSSRSTCSSIGIF